MSDSLQITLRLPRPAFTLQLDLQLPASGITVFYGPSGSGKTSVLRCVAGLERAQAARVVVGGQVWQDDRAGIFMPTHQRALGYVFQESSLFEHLDVRGNLQYGLKRSSAKDARAGASGAPAGTSASADQALQQAVQLLGIETLLRRRPQQLSGGERQRVAIARALATQPQLLLLDEPMAALDAARRQEILPWLEKLRSEWRLPMLYVTHSADELARLADHLVLLDQGRVTAAGPAQHLLARIDPPLPLGDDAGALLLGFVAERSAQWQLARVDFDGGSLWLRDSGLAEGTAVRLRVLARDVSLATTKPQHSSIQNLLPCVVDSIAPDDHPSQLLLRLRCGQALLLARITRRAQHDLALQVGSPAWAQVKSVALVQ